ncbi:5'-methylthioadenosine/S-adenosylhomocysteine nucleosidase [Bengtsoniella intestinalis]|uniref:5'-methylthioadenosine/S-adenosylhomocysteine nucleosidase n=1 Tax=Bengtsoniella intestinalis TaxID=3073143 RepID=UPI00391F7249
MKLGLLFAMAAELHAMPGLKELEPFETISGIPFFQVAPNIIACAAGIGKVNAAMGAQLLCAHFKVDLMVNSGVAGCAEDLPTGTMVVVSDFVQHDMDTSLIGDEVGFVSTVNCVSFPTYKPERTQAMLKSLGIDTHMGRTATGDWFSTGNDRGKWICDTFKPLLLEMEGCAGAQVAMRNNVPFIAVKSVSDRLFSTAQSDEYFDFPKAMEQLGAVMLPLALELQKVGL